MLHRWQRYLRQKPIDTGVSINQGYVTIINEIWVDVNAPLGGGLGMGYPPHIPQYVKQVFLYGLIHIFNQII